HLAKQLRGAHAFRSRKVSQCRRQNALALPGQTGLGAESAGNRGRCEAQTDPHGALGERLHRQNKLSVLTDLLKRIRDTGVLVGLSAHDPALVQLSEEKGWDVDYYMCCLYYLTRPREEFAQMLGGELPVGEIYLASDPPRMFKMIQAARKPCL